MNNNSTLLEKDLEEEMREFDEWFRVNLNRSFSDRAILSVLQFHVLKSYVETDISYGEMMKLLKFQYENIFANKQAQMKRESEKCQAIPT